MGREVSIHTFYLALILSIFVHLFAGYAWKFGSGQLLPSSETTESTAIEIARLPTLHAKRVDDGSEGKAQYSNEHKNRIKKQTQGERIGEYQESLSLSQKQDEEKPEQEDEFGQNVAPFTPKKWSQLFQLSQSPYKLDGVDKGEETVLNTDAVSYAGFLNRLADSIYPVWVSYLREASTLYTIEHKGQSVSDGPFITRLGIEMDKNGSLLSVQILKSCGVRAFDEAPKLAFWDQEPFRHPPSQLFDQGEPTVRFIYEFHFERKASIFSILKSMPL